MTDGGETAGRREEVHRHFAAVLELTGAERAAYLRRLGARHPELESAVGRLLAADARPDPRLDPDRWVGRRIRDDLAAASGPARPGDRVGPYRIVEEIGRGGMSVVYLVERADGSFERNAALKFLGFTHETGIRRFEMERRILAGLDHPNIARLLDGGTDERGRPYFVMEHVEGFPLDEFCRAHRASVERRLALVTTVAGAVEYAHRHLVVHRDIKPSNILVTADGEVKLLDFGIARLIEPSAAGDRAAPPTTSLAPALTPEYASPEQVRGDRITTASDVYQIGVLLYELLAGRRPFSFDGASAAEIERVVCRQVPDPPSRAAKADRRAPDATAWARRRRLRGDLDAIVLKALAKEPERRYASVGELREDLERLRQGLPIRARRATTVYRTVTFVRRHRKGLLATAALIALLAGYAATVTVQSRRIAAEAAKAEQIKGILAGFFTAANPGNNEGDDPTATELLEAGALRVRTELRDQPDVQAEMLTVLGDVYGTLGRYDDGADLLEMALRIRRRHPGGADPGVARTAYLLGEIRHYQGHLDQAESLLRECLDIRRRAFGLRSPEVATALDALGDLLHTRGKLAQAEGVLRRGLSIGSALGVGVATLQQHLANVRRDRGSFRDAEILYRQSLAATETRFGPRDPISALTRSELALLLTLTGRSGEADDLLRRNLALYHTLYPAGHPMEGTTYRNLGLLRLRQGRPAEARQLLERAVAVYRRTLGEETSLIPRARRHIAAAYLAAGDPAAAATLAADVVDRLRALGLAEHPAVADALETLALARIEQGRADEAAARLTEALAVRESTSVPTDPRLRATRSRLAHLTGRVPGDAAGPTSRDDPVPGH